MKFDFLGLKTLTVIQNALDLVNREPPGRRAASSAHQIPLDDKATYELIAPRRHRRRLPDGVQRLHRNGDEAQAVAASKTSSPPARSTGPGPLDSGMVDVFINRKHGREKVDLPAPRAGAGAQGHLRRHRLPGAGDADLAGAGRLLARPRRPAAPRHGQEEGRGHGRRSAPASSRAARRTASTSKVAGEIFDLMEKFAEYGFNKSPLRRVRPDHHPHRVAQGALPGRVHGRAAHQREGQHRQGGGAHRRGARGRATRCCRRT